MEQFTDALALLARLRQHLIDGDCGQRGRKQEYDVPGMVALLRPYAGNGVHAVLEEAQAMPGQGVRSMFTVGVGFGLWLGVLAALGIPHTRVRPADWKRTMGLLGKDKEAARLRAQQLFPGADLRRKKDHGRAEALLLALYEQRAAAGVEKRVVKHQNGVELTHGS